MHDRTFSMEWLDRVHAELNRFLNGVIHALSTGNTLGQGESEPRFAIDGPKFTHLKKDGIALDALYARLIFPALSVEDGERTSCSVAQHAQ